MIKLKFDYLSYSMLNAIFSDIFPEFDGEKFFREEKGLGDMFDIGCYKYQSKTRNIYSIISHSQAYAIFDEFFKKCCVAFECTLEELVKKYKIKITRADLNFDHINSPQYEYNDIGFWQSKMTHVELHDYVKKIAKNYHNQSGVKYFSPHAVNVDENNYDGNFTFYIGSPRSKVRMRIYNKKVEHELSDTIATSYIRYEFQIRPEDKGFTIDYEQVLQKFLKTKEKIEIDFFKEPDFIFKKEKDTIGHFLRQNVNLVFSHYSNADELWNAFVRYKNDGTY